MSGVCPYQTDCQGQACLQLMLQYTDIPTGCLRGYADRMVEYIMKQLSFPVDRHDAEDAVWQAIQRTWERARADPSYPSSHALFYHTAQRALDTLRRQYARQRQHGSWAYSFEEGQEYLQLSSVAPQVWTRHELGGVLRRIGKRFQEKWPQHADGLRRVVARTLEDRCGLVADFLVWAQLYDVPPQVLQEVWEELQSQFLTVLHPDGKSPPEERRRGAEKLRTYFQLRWPGYAPLLTQVLDAYLDHLEWKARRARRGRRPTMASVARQAGVPPHVIDEAFAELVYAVLSSAVEPG